MKDLQIRLKCYVVGRKLAELINHTVGLWVR